MDTSTKVFLTNEDGETTQVHSISLGKLPDITSITMTLDTEGMRGFTLDPRNPLVDGERKVIKTAREVRDGDRIFFRFAQAIGSGKILMHDIGLTVIRGHFHFVKTQWEIQFYSDCKELVCPAVKNQDLVFALRDLVRTDKKIPGVVKYEETSHNAGEIVFFDPFSLQGVLQSHQGPGHFHLNDVHNFSSWRRITKGMKISKYYTVPSGRTGFKWEARGIEVPLAKKIVL